MDGKWGRRLSAFGLLVSLAACVPHGTIFQPLPANSMVETSRVAALSQSVAGNEIGSFRALVTLELKRGEESLTRFRLAAVFAAPDKLRLETLPVQGFYTLGLLVTNAGATDLIEGNDRTRRTHAAAPEALVRQMLGVALGVTDLFRLVTAREAELPADGRWGQRSATGPILFSSAKAHVQYQFDAVTNELMLVDRFDRHTDQLLYRLEVLEMSLIAGKMLPRVGRVTLPQEGLTLDFTIGKLTLNDNPPAALFVAPGS